MKRLASSFCILGICIGCSFAVMAVTCPKEPLKQVNTEHEAEENRVTVFLTGNVLSTLKPCGCASGQLGGFDRRATILRKTAHDREVIIDTGNFLVAETEQDIIKFGIIFQALSMLEYDLVNLTEDDLRIAEELGLLENALFNIISNAADNNDKVGSSYTRQLRINNQSLLLSVVTINFESEQIDLLQELFPSDPNAQNLNILIINDCDNSTIEYISDVGIVDVVICPTFADEPRIVDKERTKPLFVSVGQFGKYIGKLTVRLTAQKQLKLDYEKVTIDENLPEDQALVQLYKDYQFIVKEGNLLEQISRVPLPSNLEYLGSRSCRLKPCHPDEHEIWSTNSPHAKAYQTLVDVGSQYDPECIECHVVGLKYETGFVNEKSQDDLRNVGCEVCHGPGSQHMTAVLMDEEGSKTTEPKSMCIDCHTPDHSPDYETHQEEFLKKIVHWKEHNQDTTVQK